MITRLVEVISVVVDDEVLLIIITVIQTVVVAHALKGHCGQRVVDRERAEGEDVGGCGG